MKKTKIIAYIGLILSILLIMLGGSLAKSSYFQAGNKISSMTTGSITFLYTEVSNIGNGINITDAFPMSDEEGIKKEGEGNVFDFKIESKLSRSDIEYEIVAQPTKESTLPLDAIKLYLTEVNDEIETPVANCLEDDKVKTLDKYNDTTIENASGKTIYQETILRNTKGYTKNFRVRMWVSEDIDLLSNGYIGASGMIKINAYANSDKSMASASTTNPSDASVSMITTNNQYLFDSVENEEYNYTVTVPNEVEEADITVVTNNMDATVSIEKIDNASAFNNFNYKKLKPMSLNSNANTKFMLNTGENFFKAVVTSSDKSKKEEYILRIIREESSNVDLNNLEVVGYNLVPKYSNNQNLYTVDVPYETTSITINAEKKEAIQTITGLGNYKLDVGANVINVKVTAEDGTLRNIQITINRNLSDDASIKNVGVTGYTLTHVENNIYSVTVGYNVENIEITNTSTNGATVTGTGLKNDLKFGINDYEVEVTSASKVNKNKYVIRVIREKDSNNTLNNLELSGYEITPKFNKDVLLYSVTVENDVTNVGVIAGVASEVASYKVEGNTNLKVGENKINVVVTAQNGEKRTYVITVTRKASSDATLQGLIVSTGTLSPEFSSSEISYKVTVPYTVTSLTVTPTVNNSEASVKVEGNTDLKVGENTVKVEVTAGNGTKKIYTIVVTREQDTVNTLSGLSLTSCTLSPAFNSTTTEYTCTVENSVTKTTVSATKTATTSDLTGDGEHTLKVGTNEIIITVTAQNGSIKTYKVVVTRKASMIQLLNH